MLLLGISLAVILNSNWLGALAMVCVGCFIVVSTIPHIAVAVRRMHDIDKSAGYLLVTLIPAVGGLVFLVLMCLPGTEGPNRFGNDPKQLEG